MKIASASPDRADFKWWVFGAIAIGTFVSVLDQTSVNLALPRIADHFDATIPVVQWVALGYILTTGSLLLPMGRLSDMIGRKRVYVIGFAIFIVGGILAGSSVTLLGLILSKILQGVGAAMVQANGMAIITSAFPASERGKVIGLFMTVVGLGAIAGPVVGGGIVEFFGWRYVFFMGVPLGMASIIAALVILEGRAAGVAGQRADKPRFDWGGALTSTAAVAIFLLVMTNAHRVGWGSPLVVTAFAAVVVLFVTFVWWERRAREPMMALELFRRRLFTLGSSAGFLHFMAGTSVFFLMPFYLQEVLEYSPGEAGLIMAPTAVCFAVLGPIAGRLSDRFGWRQFAVFGLVMSGASLFTLSQLTESAPVGLVIGALAMQGIGMGTFYSPNASAVLSTVERSRYGIATAFLNMVRNTANVTGLAVATTIVVIVMSSQGFEPSLEAVASGGQQGVQAAFTDGLRTAFLVMTGFVGLAIVLSLITGGATVEETAVPERDLRVPSQV